MAFMPHIPLCVVPAPLQIINDIRNRTGARVNLFDEEKGCGDRVLQVTPNQQHAVLWHEAQHVCSDSSLFMPSFGSDAYHLGTNFMDMSSMEPLQVWSSYCTCCAVTRSCALSLYLGLCCVAV
jgi:hypothetical protein